MFNELDIVKLLVQVESIPKDSIGTIVHDYEDNNTYEVEFEQGVIQVKSDQICAQNVI